MNLLTNNLFVTTVISVASGIIASLVAILFWEQYRKPKLSIEIPAKTPGQEPSIQQDQARAFYHLRVRNDGKSPAYNCKVFMRFFDANYKNQLFSPVNGKWDRGPEPVVYHPVPERVMADGTIAAVQMVETRQPYLVPFCETIDLHPNIPSEGICILLKYDNEEECWPFSSWSYFLDSGHRVKDWKLSKDRHVVEVELVYSGKGSVKLPFLIINEGTKMDSVEIRSYQGDVAHGTWLVRAFARLWRWWKKHGSIPFLVAAGVNISLLLYLLFVSRGIDAISKATYTYQNLAATLALFVALTEARRKSSKVTLTIAIELFIVGMFSQLLGLFGKLV